MPAVSRLFDSSAGACGFPPTKVVSCSPNVYTNNRGNTRNMDSYAPHPHGIKAIGCANQVYANNRLLHRLGDPCTCGDRSASASPNVFAG